MPFDGRGYSGSSSLLTPIYHHPSAPAVADVPAESLRAGYQFLRHNANLVGYQTWPLYMRDPGTAYTLARAFAQTTYVDVFDVEEAYIPANATHVFAEAHWRLSNTEPVTLYHRVRIDVGGSSVTSDATTETRNPPTNASVFAFTKFAPDDPLNGITRAVAVLSSVADQLPARVRVRIQAYAVAESSAAEWYEPNFAAAWWESIA